MSDPYISVSQVNMYIKNIFDSEIMLQDICVFGEVSSYNISGGNAYFNIKDENGMLSCVLFGASKFDSPQIGDMILARGSVSYYAKGGRLSFNVYSIMPYGRGLLYEKFLKLKQDLEERGYFAQEHKVEIPSRVKKIGVVTSQTGAVIRDIIDVTQRRNDTIDIVLYPVKVQGLGADREIALGIDFFSNYDDVDVVIVARGGGSIEDMEPFNSEIVATSAYRCNKPLVSAVGHETDYTIIDFVADLRAPTPSAGAELVAWDKSVLADNINNSVVVMEKSIAHKIDMMQGNIEYEIECLNNSIDNLLRMYCINASNSIDKLSVIDKILDVNTYKIDKYIALLELYNPNKITAMGYSKVLSGDCAVRSIKDVKVKDCLTLSFVDGKCNCIVEEVWV